MSRSWLTAGINALLFAAIAIVALSPGGPLGGFYSDWKDARAERELLAAVKQEIEERSGGSITVLEFADYECPFCRASQPSVDSAVSQGSLEVVWVHLPLVGLHPEAERAARAAICGAEALGRPDVHNQLLSTSAWADGHWREFALDLSISPRELADCMDSQAVTERLERDAELARSLGISATPTFVSTFGIHEGQASVRDLLGLVEGA